MSWRQITDSDVLAEFNPAERAVLQNVQGAADKLPEILDRVVRAARGAIQAGGNQLGQESTVPDQVHMDVVAIVRWRWLIALPQMKALQTPERRSAYDDAMKRLDGIATGKPRVEVPENPIATTTPSTLSSVEERDRKFTQSDQEGI